MLPKCICCKKKLIRSEAHKVEIKNEDTGEIKKILYCCSEEEYSKMIKERENKDAVYEEIREKYFPAAQMISSLPRLIFIDIGGISNIRTWEQILDYLHDDEEYLTNIMKKDFSSYDVRAKYFAKVVLNRIERRKAKFNKQSEVQTPVIKQTEDNFIAPSFTPKKQKTDTRKGFDDLLEDL